MVKENNNEKECQLCQVPKETISQLKERAKEKHSLKKEAKGRERLLGLKQKRMKMLIKFLIFILIAVGVVFGLKYFWSKVPPSQSQEKPKITVFYSPTCGCCLQYLSYLKRNGFEVLEEKNMAKRMEVLERYQLPEDLQACHSSLVGNYFVEGHMPAEVIKKILQEKPEIDGIALPGMPQGSPGMPGFKTTPFQIYSLSKGQISEYLTY